MSAGTMSEQLRDGIIAMRLENAPSPDDPRASSSVCKRCGVEFLRWKRRPKPFCPECAGLRVQEQVDGMDARSGPVYEQMVRRQLQHWTVEAARLGLKPGG